MKYIKVAVPDDFAGEIVFLKDETGKKAKYIAQDVWKPVYHSVLDYGYIGLVDFMGDDQAVVDAARVSYGVGTRRVSQDQILLRYLMRHRHLTPFEMAAFKFHVKLPIFVERQWIRHRSGSTNEYSGRYSVMTDEMYLPAHEHLMAQAEDNRQGRAGELSDNDRRAIVTALEQIFDESYQCYTYLLGKSQPNDSLLRRKHWLEELAINAVAKMREEHPDWDLAPDAVEQKVTEYFETNGLAFTSESFKGLARELSRIALPLATYTQKYWMANLRNILGFLSLRADPHAQYEIRAYADRIMEIMMAYVPWTMNAFSDYQLNGGHFSRIEMDIIRIMAAKYSKLHDGDTRGITRGMLMNGVSKREVNEFLNKLQLEG